MALDPEFYKSFRERDLEALLSAFVLDRRRLAGGEAAAITFVDPSILAFVDDRIARIVAEFRRRGHTVYACPACGAVSYNSNDAEAKYCGRCHAFEDPR